jgi:hypothetical protein
VGAARDSVGQPVSGVGHYLPVAAGSAVAVSLLALVRPEGWWWLLWGYCAVAVLFVVAWFVRGLGRPR